MRVFANEASEPVRIVKVGGSLLTYRELPTALQRWLCSEGEAGYAVLVGGGPVVDGIRAIDRALVLDEPLAHRVSLDGMQINARIVQSILPDSALVDSRLQAEEAIARGLVPVLDPTAILTEIERDGDAGIPTSWDATSDTIAAAIAQSWGAKELVLLKSRLPAHPEMTAMEREGYVDRCFARTARGIGSIRCVNLRSGSESMVFDAGEAARSERV